MGNWGEGWGGLDGSRSWKWMEMGGVWQMELRGVWGGVRGGDEMFGSLLRCFV